MYVTLCTQICLDFGIVLCYVDNTKGDTLEMPSEKDRAKICWFDFVLNVFCILVFHFFLMK